MAFRTHVAGNQDLPRVGKAHGHEGDQHQHFTADGHGGKTLCADKVADNDHIHHVVDHLQQAGKEQRHRERQQRLRHAACRQIPDQCVLFLHLKPRKTQNSTSFTIPHFPGNTRDQITAFRGQKLFKNSVSRCFCTVFVINPLTPYFPRATLQAISYKAVTKTEQQEAPQRAGYGVNRRAEASSHRFRAGDPKG